MDSLARWNGTLALASRFGSPAREGERISVREIALLLVAGMTAAVAVAVVAPGLRLPGSAILRAGIPLAAGIAFVPRRGAGTVTAIGGLCGWAVLSATGIGRWQPASVVGLVALGPVIDVLLFRNPPSSLPLYLRFAIAGMVANGLAFAVRVLTAWSDLDTAGPRPRIAFGPATLASFLGFGLAAGLLGAIVAFRARPAARDAQE